MQSYLSEQIKNTNNKLYYILKKKKINFDINDEFINFNLHEDIINFTIYFNLLFKPEFIVMNDCINKKTIMSNNYVNNDKDNNKNQYNNSLDDENILTIENLKLCEEINLNIDEYDCVEDIIYYIVKKNNLLLENKKVEKNISKKNHEKFKLFLEQKKNDLITNEKDKNLTNIGKNLTSANKSESVKLNNLSNSTGLVKDNNLFSKRACVEMLGDQVLKIFLSDNFDVDVKEFPNIKITMSNFSFKGSDSLLVSINMKLDLNIFNKPPKIEMSSNKILKDNILKIICELKPFSDINSWSVKYSIYDSVVNIYNMINTYGETNIEFASELDKLINDLEYLLSIRSQSISEEKLLKIFDKDFNKISENKSINYEDNKNNKKNKKNNTLWKKGTGYGHEGLEKWDIDSYIKSVNQKKNNINKMFNTFINKLSNDYSNFDKIDKNSVGQIIKLLINYMYGEEITAQNIMLISNVIFKNLEILNTYTDFEDNYAKLLDLIKNFCEDNNIEHELFKNNKISKIITSSKKISSDPFENIFDEYKFIMYPEEFQTFYYDKLCNINSEKLLGLKKEFGIIKKSISVNNEASIFFRVEKNNLSKMKFIISGPSKTPYDQGLYIFDMTLSNEYPTKPPLVHFSNNGGQRFNPNLYNCGKVCLSLLGTWRGEKGESWNSQTSTFFQILVSIQSQILIEEPYFNEPGHETYIGKTFGIESSKSYNNDIRQYNLDHAMNDLIEGIINNKSPYPEFDNIIRNYFKFKKNRILEILSKWELEYSEKYSKDKFINSKNKFIKLVEKL